MTIAELRVRIRNLLAQETPPAREWELREMLQLCDRMLEAIDQPNQEGI